MSNKDLIPQEIIEKNIYLIRGYKVILDKDLAKLYGVETRTLNQAVKRNIKRFPCDFMIKLNRDEIMRISQIVTSLKFSKSVNAFTEQGVAILSSVLNSERAIQVNIQIMRTFVKLREILSSNKELSQRLDKLEKKYDKRFSVVFDAIKQLMTVPDKPKRRIGF